MHIHNVYFWLNDCSDADRAGFEKGLAALMEISQIQTGYWGVPAGVDREVVDGSYDYSLSLIFNTRADHDTYQSDADHDLFIERHKHLWSAVKVFDTTSR